MTRDELHIAFKIEMDKNSQSVAYGGCPSFLPEEVDYWLNKGYYDVLISKFSGNNTTRIPFEGSVKRISDLERLVKTDKAVNAITIEGTNQIVIENLLNRNQDNKGRMFFVQAILHWNENSSIVNLVNHQQAKKFIKTYNNVPWIEEPVATIQDNTLMIYVDPISMKGDYTVDITYIKHPTLISELPSDTGLTEVPEQVQNEIINRAVELALEDIESKRLTTKNQLNQLTD